MGAQQIAELLKRNHPRLLASAQISLDLKIGKISINRSLRSLIKRNEIIYVMSPSEDSRGGWIRKYGIKLEE